MADRKITELAALSAGGQATGDLLTIVDVSESAAADKNKKITMENLFKGIPGDVGIGVSSPSHLLDLSNSSNAYIRQTRGSSAFRVGPAGDQASDGVVLGTDTNGPLRIFTNGSTNERMRIDTDGRLLVGLSSSLLAYAQLQLSGGSDNTGHICLAHTSAAPAVGQNIGSQRYTNSAGGIGAIVGVEADADWTAGSSFPSRITFQTTANGASSPTERLRIDSSGRVAIGTTSALTGANLTVAGAALAVTGQNAAHSANSIRIGEEGSGLAEIRYYGPDSSTNGSLRLRSSRSDGSNNQDITIDSSGNVGIGATAAFSNGSGLMVQRSGTACVRLDDSANSKAGEIYADSSGLVIDSRGSGAVTTFDIGGTEKVRIDNSGQVGIGTSSPSDTLHLNGSTGYGLKITDASSHIGVYRTHSDGAVLKTASNHALLFGTNDDERMRIDSDGRVLINKTAKQATEIFGFTFGAGSQGCNSFVNSAATQSHFVFTNSNGAVGSISTNGSATTFSTSSDHRLKENVVDLDDAITRVKQLQPRRFNFIADADTTVDGFVAHEAQTVVPEAVTGTHNEVDDDGNAVMQRIDQSKLVPLLTAALKEAIAKIETLETKVAALEAQ